MKHIISYLLVILSFQAYSQTYHIDEAFQDDKEYNFTVKRAKIESDQPMTKKLSQLTQVKAKFIHKGTQLVCIWKYGETKAVGPSYMLAQLGAEHKKIINLYEGIEAQVLIDMDNNEVRLLNLEAMKKNIAKAMLKVYNNKLTKISSEDMKVVMQKLAPTYTTSEALLNTYFPEIPLYFQLYGAQFPVGKTFKSLYKYPNPFGGEALPVNGEIGIDSKQGNILKVKLKEKAVDKEVSRIIRETVVALSKGGKRPINGNEIPDFSLDIETSFFYDLNLKLMKKVSQDKSVIYNKKSTKKILEIKLIN